MIAALFVAGPALLLAIMAWAIDRFMPLPSSSFKASERSGSSTEVTAAPRPTASSKPLPLDPGTIRAAFDGAEDAQEFVPLARALQRFEGNRSRSMVEDHYPDPVLSRYTDIDSLELKDQKIVFEKGGRVRLEARTTVAERRRPVISAASEARAGRLIR